MVASTLYYWLPPDVDVLHGRAQAPGRAPGRSTDRDGTVIGRYLLGHRRRGRPGGGGTAPATWRASSRTPSRAHLVADVPGGVVPQRRPRLQPGDRDGAAAADPGSRPTPSPSGRRTSGSRRCLTTRGTPGSWPAPRHPTARDRDQPGRRDLLPRMVDLLDEPIGDPAAINTLLMCGRRSRSRRQGAALRHGRRRALRWLPQAPRLPAGGALPAGCRVPAHPGRRPAVRRLPVRVGGRGLRLTRWAQALRLLRRPRRGGGVPPQLHPARPRRARRAARLPSSPSRSTGSSTHTAGSTTTRP